MYRLLILIFISISVAACMPKPNRADPIPTESTPAITEPGCQPSLIQESQNSFPEIQGTMNSKGEIWALLFFGEAHAKEDLKIVWRITGGGQEVIIQAQNEDGTIIQPIWGPEFHESSNWERPGTEWGTGFNFTEPGCWTITITLGATEGEINLDVLPELAPNIQGELWVIFSAERARYQGIGTFVGNSQTAEHWTPSESDILALENGLGAFLENNPDRFSEGTPVWERLDEYNRQYIGIILDGKKIIYANFFCESTGRDWITEFIFVLDGGDCYFQFKYDVDSGEFFDLQVNGVA
jgi:hypothetical protein